MRSVESGAFEEITGRRPTGATSSSAIVTTEFIQMQVNRARQLRAETIAALFRRFGSWLASAFRPRRRPQIAQLADTPESYALVEDQLKVPLASIRSAAEILRHNQELPVDERNRFLDVVLQDNGRLEEAVDGLLRTLQGRAEQDRRLMRNRERLERPAA
jgi:signal transduction histidine kinase